VRSRAPAGTAGRVAGQRSGHVLLLRIANEIAKKAPNKMAMAAAVPRVKMMRVLTKPARGAPGSPASLTILDGQEPLKVQL
jgi:hypothetical protein